MILESMNTIMRQASDRIDLHLHSVISDGTDMPKEILEAVRTAGLKIFSITDHDAIKASTIMPPLLKEKDPRFITGAEFSCKDEEGRYHILGYGYDPEAPSIRQTVEEGHTLRIQKAMDRVEFLKTEFGFTFPKEEIEAMLALDNPGKPHLGNLMAKYGYAANRDEAILRYINQRKFEDQYIRPETAIQGILGAGGIPVLAHPSYGSGDELILHEEMDHRLQKLMAFGLQGVEAFYSGFTKELKDEILAFADQYRLYVTAGSDYHGKNKTVILGDTGLDPAKPYPEGLLVFLAQVRYIN